MAVHKSTTAPTTAPLSKNNKRRIILIIAPLTVLIISTLAFIFMPRSYPLDDQIEYLGKTDYGCILVCDSPPASVYYYSTDMNTKELASHFTQATLLEKSSKTAKTIIFGLRSPGGETVHVHFYTDKSEAPSDFQFTNKKYIFDIPDTKYTLLKSLL